MAKGKVLIDFRGDISDWELPEKDARGVWRTSSYEGVRMAVEEGAKGSDVVLNIDSNGGSVSEGLKIYDFLTTYDYGGGQLYTNIVGACHSMAVVVLLTAPLENRSANANVRALIHEVRTWGDDITVEEAERLAQQLKMEQDAILDIYAQRTTTPRERLEEVMKEEREHTAKELQEMGFISEINEISVNKYLLKNTIMGKSTAFYNKFILGLRQVANKLNGGEDIVNFDYKDKEGEIVFSIEGNADALEVGVPVVIADGSTAGVFTLDDGRVVTIAEGVVAEIVTPNPDDKKENEGGENADPEPEPNAGQEAEVNAGQEAEVNALKELLETAKGTISEQKKELDDLRAEVARLTAGNHKPNGRPANAFPKPKGGEGAKSVEQIKAEAIERAKRGFGTRFEQKK